jgi:hypothetical protein
VAYTFDNLFAADPSNPTNVASNASILLYDPADPTKAPVTITDPTGSPIPNPVTVNKNGFGPAMQHATLDRLAWEGGGFSNFITSYEGIKNEAVSARTAAQEAAATAGADAAAVATAAIGTATDEATAAAAAATAAADAADASALAAANSAALVGAPADNAIATAINATGSATKAALSATIATVTNEQVPPAVSAALAADPTIEEAMTLELAGRGLLETVTGESESIGLAFTDEAGDRTWLETDAAGKPTQFAADRLREKMAAISASNSDALGVGLSYTDETGKLIGDLQFTDTGRFTGAVLDGMINRRTIQRPVPIAVSSLLTSKLTLITNTAAKYVLNTWWVANWASQDGSPYLTLAGTGQNEVRPISEAAYAVAGLIGSGTYDPAITGVTLVDAKARAIRMLASTAYRHKANGGTWGSASNANLGWQEAMWTALVGQAAKNVWADMTATDQGYVTAMLEWEGAKLADWGVPYYKDRAGNTLISGDSKMEEIAWNAMLATAYLTIKPAGSLAEPLTHKFVEMSLAAMARPADIYTTTTAHGGRLSDFIEGSNLEPDGGVMNHGGIHADYFCSAADIWAAGVNHARAGQVTPLAAFFNAPRLYSALTDVKYGTQTIYTPGSATVYYPQINDWGNERVIQFACLDVLAAYFGLDTLSTTKAVVWAELHLDKVLAQQARSTTGQMYQPEDGNVAAEPETWSAMLATKALLAAKTAPALVRAVDLPATTIARKNRGNQWPA